MQKYLLTPTAGLGFGTSRTLAPVLSPTPVIPFLHVATALPNWIPINSRVFVTLEQRDWAKVWLKW